MSTRESASIKPSSQNPNDAPDQASPTRRPQLGVPIFIPGSGDDVKYDTRHG